MDSSFSDHCRYCSARFGGEVLIFISIHISFYFKYINDIVLLSPVICSDRILQIFNYFHPRLQFTVELVKNRKLNFLDVTYSHNQHR